MFSWIKQGNQLTIVLDGTVHTINSTTHHQYDQIIDHIKAKEYDKVSELITHSTAITQYSKGLAKIIDGALFWQGSKINGVLADRVLELFFGGFPIDSFINFLEKLKTNPTPKAIEGLYDFLEFGQIPITPDGDFIAFKRVRGNFKDHYTNTIDNSVGKTVTMPRSACDADRNATCSTGLHFCSLKYLSDSGFAKDSSSVTVLVKINPANVVAIPTDYNNTKGRCCEYTVIEVLTGQVKEFSTPVYTKTSPATPVKEEPLATPLKADKPTVPTTPVKKDTPSTQKATQPSGKQLSMTPNAIRKRERRAAAKNNN